jgi:hypothetical protein
LRRTDCCPGGVTVEIVHPEDLRNSADALQCIVEPVFPELRLGANCYCRAPMN